MPTKYIKKKKIPDHVKIKTLASSIKANHPGVEWEHCVRMAEECVIGCSD